jgi:hypothetical protein
LPADEQITPRRFSSSESWANLFSGPRILYGPGALEQLGFEAHVEPGALAQDAGREQRGVMDVLAHPGPRGKELVGRDWLHVGRILR